MIKIHSLIAVVSMVLLAACSEQATESKPQAKVTEPTPQGWLKEQYLQDAEKIKQAALASNLGYDIIESLTTEVGPRMAGTPNDAKAVAWGVAKLKELGFEKVWTEDAPFPTWVRGEEQASIVAPFPQKLHITALGNSIGTGDIGLRAPIVHFESLEALSKAERADVEGKIVFISAKMEPHKDGRGYGQVVGGRSRGAVEAAKLGAAAIMIRSVGTDSDRFAHTGNMRYEEGVPKIPAAAMSNPDADMIIRQLKRGSDVIVDMKLTSHAGPDYVSQNVIGEIVGSEKPGEIVLIGAHLDSWDLGTGALDDGAGIGITVAAAKTIMELGLKPKRTIRVVMFANEEQGLWGGRAYAKAHADELKDHIVGVESDFGAGYIYRWDYNASEEAMPTVAQIAGALASLDIELGKHGTGSGPDLIPAYQMGMNSARLNQNGYDYFHYHHTANDTLDKVDPESLRQNVAAYAVFAYLSAQMDGRFVEFTGPRN